MAVSLHADVFIPGQSIIHRWAARPKLLSLLALMFAIAMVRQLILLPWVFVVVGGLYLWSQLPLSYLARRLPYPGLFIVAMVGLLPWVSGETVLWQWSFLALRLEGVQVASLIAGRFLAILTTGFILLGTTPFLTLLEVMRSLGIPPLLTDMTLLTYRYLFDIANQLATMRQAMQLRGLRAVAPNGQPAMGLASGPHGQLAIAQLRTVATGLSSHASARLRAEFISTS